MRLSACSLLVLGGCNAIFGLNDNAKIGANAVVYKDIPENAVVVLDPGFSIISMAGNRQRGDSSS